jgi:hypothetical protein
VAKPIPKDKLLYLVGRKQWREWLKRNHKSDPHFILKTEQNKQFGHGGIEKY